MGQRNLKENTLARKGLKLLLTGTTVGILVNRQTEGEVTGMGDRRHAQHGGKGPLPKMVLNRQKRRRNLCKQKMHKQ
ncbi:UNVERIFIED_CONTAM: hypothetical protein K2H54_061662 [Gekko kuhli]